MSDDLDLIISYPPAPILHYFFKHGISNSLRVPIIVILFIVFTYVKLKAKLSPSFRMDITHRTQNTDLIFL